MIHGLLFSEGKRGGKAGWEGKRANSTRLIRRGGKGGHRIG